MKNNKYIIFVLVAVLMVITAGCGEKEITTNPDNKPTTEVTKYTLKLPVEGFVGQYDDSKNTFVLATLPKNESKKTDQHTVIVDKETLIEDKDGNPTTVKNYDRVRIEKGSIDTEIKATKIVVTRSSEKPQFEITIDSGTEASKPVDYNDVPGILIAEVGELFPKSFPDSAWVTQVPQNHPTITDAKIIELVKDDWSIYLLSNPETQEKYSVTITDRNEFEWTGLITKDNKVIQK